MVVAMVFINFTELFVKLATEVMPVGELIFIRSLFSTALLGVVAMAMGSWRGWRELAGMFTSRALSIRLAAEISATLCYVGALAHIPIANAAALIQVAPLAALAVAATVLGQSVGWRRWTATAVGFVGVLLVIQPGTDGFEPAGLLALGAAASVAIRDLATRYVEADVPTVMIAFVTSVALIGVGLVMAPFETWVMPTGTDTAVVAASAAFLAAFYLLVITAFRLGDPVAVAPMRYTKMVWALAAGWLVWGDWPDLIAFTGLALIVGAGLYAFLREAALARAGGAQS